MSLRVLWNALIPWRRRRRYYFTAVVHRLRQLDLPGSKLPGAADVPPIDFPAAVGMSPTDFVETIEGQIAAPRYLESLAIAAYKVPPPPASFIYGPPVVALLAIAWVSYFLFMLLH